MGVSSQQSEDAITDINVTPLVDVSLVLVIIFMAIAPFGLQSGIKVLSSKAQAAVGQVSEDANVSVRLTKDGVLKINGKEADFGTLYHALKSELEKSKDKMVILTADDENKVGEVVQVLDTAKQVDKRAKLAIMRAEKPAEGTPGGEEPG